MDTFGRDLKIEYEPSMFDEVNVYDRLVPMALTDSLISTVFSFFNGSDMVHVLSRLSKKYRAGNPDYLGQSVKLNIDALKILDKLGVIFKLVNHVIIDMSKVIDSESAMAARDVWSFLCGFNSIATKKVFITMTTSHRSFEDISCKYL